MNKRKLKVIIAIDGGGIRGIFPLLILAHINALIKEHQLSDNISSSVDLIAGTSAGAIISAGLIVKENNKNIYSLEELLGLYALRGPQLFNLANPGHEKSEGLRLVLKRRFKDILLSDLDIHFAFVSFDVVTKTPFVFEKNKDALSKVTLSTALAACSAIPGYFPSVRLGDHDLVDGMMAAKNPSKIAYEQAKVQFPDDAYLLLSFGTGQLKEEMYDEIEKEVRGAEEFLENKSHEDDRLIYYRFQPEIKTADPQMDNAKPENIAALIEDGKSYIQENTAIFDRLIEDWKKYQ
jgi:predicted acylesterase/phospholipase RssA